MALLFIDSTYDITLGLLDESHKWISFKTYKGQKASSVLQMEAWKLLKDVGKKANSLEGLVSCSGPGFYTGLRLSEGFSDVFHFFGVPRYSFYSYEVPRWCGFESGVWFTKAYRGEYFLYHWEGARSASELISSKELKPLSDVFIHSEPSLDEQSLKLMKNPQSTLDFIRVHPEKIFPRIVQNHLSREAYYFRAPEDEFKANP